MLGMTEKKAVTCIKQHNYRRQLRLSNSTYSQSQNGLPAQLGKQIVLEQHKIYACSANLRLLSKPVNN